MMLAIQVSVVWRCHWVFHDIRVMVAPSSGVKQLFTHQGAKKVASLSHIDMTSLLFEHPF
jgi:hypothetical protein